MARVEGIGGVFVDSNDASWLAACYRDVLGVETERHPDRKGYYKVFPTRDVDTMIVREKPVFAINQA